MWRNRIGAEKIDVHVKILNEDRKEWEFHALEYELRSFDYTNEAINALSIELQTLREKRLFITDINVLPN